MSLDSQFEKIVSVDNLRKAWIKVFQYARTEEVYFDEYAYCTFAEHLEARLIDLSKELRDGTYRPSPLRYITIPKGNKERKIYFMSPKDSVVIQAVINIIGPEFEKNFIPESFGNRLNIDLHESKDIYQSWQEKYSEYVSTVRGFIKYGLKSWYLITDIENFYPSVSQDWLIGLIRAKVDNQASSLIELFVRNNAINSSEEIEAVPGIPPGALYSHFFANIYLNDFDYLAQKLTLGYARYVDDICFVCRNQDDLERAKKELSNYLNRWRQKFKEVGKTVQRPIFDIVPLFEHTQNMKYAIRLDVVETHEESAEAISMVGVTEKPFSRLYRIAEKEGDLGRIVDEAAFVISFLKKSEDSELANVIYSLIETHPVRPSTLKAALIYLLEIENPNPSKKFLDFFFNNKDRPAYISSLFLRLLVGFEWNIDLKAEIIRAYCSDPNYLVRASAYFALSNIGKGLEFSLFNTLLLKEKSSYAKTRLLDCFSILDKPFDIYRLIEYLEDSLLSVSAIRSYITLITDNKIEKEILNTIWGFVKEKGTNFEFLIYMFYISATQGFYWIDDEILEHDDSARFILVAPSISLETINELAKYSEIIRLHTFTNHVQKMGFLDAALVGYFEISEKTSSAELSSEIASVVKSVELGANLPEWIANPETTRLIYRQSFGDQDYLCQYLDDNKQHRGILEIISFERIKSGGFSSYEEWGAYLNELSKNQVIPKIHLAKYSDAKFACFYEIPDDFSSIAEIMASDVAKESLSQTNILQLGESLLANIEKFRKPNFCFHSIDPISVLWSPLTGKNFLVGIGASLGTGKYHCGIAGCKEPTGEDEIGVTATIFHFGLFVFQLLSCRCPIEQIHAVTSKYYSSIRLSDLLANLDVLPHFRMILGRVLNSDPDKRYGSLDHLLSDFKQANQFKKDLDLPSINNEKNRPTIILVDFMLFRLRVISRNPNLRRGLSISHSKSILEELANTVQYLPVDLAKLWNVGLDRESKFVEFPSEKDVKKLSPEGIRLLDIAYGWEKICDIHNLRRNHLTPLSRVFLYRCFAIEALASYSGLITKLSESQIEDVNSRLVKFSDLVEKILGDGEDEREVFIKINSVGHKVFMSKKDLFELQRLPLWRKGDVNYYDYISSLKVLGLFLVLTHSIVGVVINGKVEYVSDSVNIKNNFDEKAVWILLHLLPALDEQIELLQEMVNDDVEENSIGNNDVWLRYNDLFTLIKKVNPARRKSANIYSYQVKSYKIDADGRLEFGLIRKQGKSFDTKFVFLSGSPTSFDQDIQRPVLFDLLQLPDRSQKITSVLAPIGKFTELPFKKRFIPFINISMFIYKQKRKFGIIRLAGVAIIGLFCAWLAGSVDASLTGSTNPSISGGVAVLSTLSLAVLSIYVERLIKTIDPEDYDLVGRANRK